MIIWTRVVSFWTDEYSLNVFQFTICKIILLIS